MKPLTKKEFKKLIKERALDILQNYSHLLVMHDAFTCNLLFGDIQGATLKDNKEIRDKYIKLSGVEMCGRYLKSSEKSKWSHKARHDREKMLITLIENMDSYVTSLDHIYMYRNKSQYNYYKTKLSYLNIDYKKLINKINKGQQNESI